MKAKPEDLLHKLATGEDKLEKIARIKDRLKKHGYRVRIARRKTAKGYKTYFTVMSTDPLDNLFTNRHQTSIRWILRQEFPSSIMTSGGGSSMTFAEY